MFSTNIHCKSITKEIIMIKFKKVDSQWMSNFRASNNKKVKGIERTNLSQICKNASIRCHTVRVYLTKLLVSTLN